jgi:hypothetical protein
VQQSYTSKGVRRVWERYAAAHPRRPATRARLELIRRRLRDGYTPDQLVRAIEGNLASPWHQGENDRGRRYDTLELVLRADKVDSFIAMAGPSAEERNEAERRQRIERLEDRLHDYRGRLEDRRRDLESAQYDDHREIHRRAVQELATKVADYERKLRELTTNGGHNG